MDKHRALTVANIDLFITFSVVLRSFLCFSVPPEQLHCKAILSAESFAITNQKVNTILFLPQYKIVSRDLMDYNLSRDRTIFKKKTTRFLLNVSPFVYFLRALQLSNLSPKNSVSFSHDRQLSFVYFSSDPSF